MGIVIEAYTALVNTCLYVEIVRVLDELLRPAPRAPPVVEQPWVVVWPSAEACYAFYLRALGLARWVGPVASRSGWFRCCLGDGICWRELATGASSISGPPVVSLPWSVHWCNASKNVVLTQADGVCSAWVVPPTVPEGWEVRWCDEGQRFFLLARCHAEFSLAARRADVAGVWVT